MTDIDHTRPNRDVGSMLSGAEVENLRAAVNWVRDNRGLRLTDIALGCDAPEHTVRNFAYRKSNRPDNAFLGKLYKYFVSHREMLPENFFSVDGDRHPEARAEAFGRLSRYDLVKMEMPISEDDLKRVFERYSGYYLCFRRSIKPNRVSASWLHIRPLKANLDAYGEDLPLPRFTLFTRYPDPVDPGTAFSHIIGGYAFSRSGRIFLAGHHDGELQHFTLIEPSTRKFTYVQGLCLLTSFEEKPFAAKVVCQYLGPMASREEWDDKIGGFSEDDFNTTFDNAKIIMRALGDHGLLTAAEAQ